MGEWTPELLAKIAGVVISLLFSYFPVLKDWYEKLTAEQKSLVMIGVLLGISVVVFLLSCFTSWIFVACTWAGAQKMLEVFLYALITNQATYLVTRTIRRK